jgi:hypothetical protein
VLGIVQQAAAAAKKRKMSAAYGIIPALGGITLLVGGTLALMIDRNDLHADPTTPQPILVRYTSQATYDVHKRPHWIFIVTTCVFGPCLVMTAIWQAALAQELEDTQQATMDNLPFLLILQATLCAVGGYGVAVLPMGNTLGTIIHVITASIFAIFGIQYCFRAYQLASDRGDDALATVRLALGLFGGVGGLTTCVSVYPGVAGTFVLDKHQQVCQTQPNNTTANQEDNEDFLSVRGRWWARIGETILAIGQISIAIAMALCVLSATVEVGDVSSDEPPTAWWVGGIIGVVMTLGAVLFYRTNDFWYATCQRKQQPEDGEDDDEKETEMKTTVEN